MPGLDAVSDFHVEGIIKKKTPRKHYVFSIQVEWKNGVIIQIYRRYRTILALQLNLLKLDEFLTYLHTEYAQNRTGYLLPDKTLFGKFGVKTANKALTKMREVDEFLKSVIHLPRSISRSDVVLEFFRPLPEDMMSQEANDFSDYSIKETKATRRMGYALNISEPILLEQYVATCEYTKTLKNGLSLKAGNIVEVITMGEHGWWFVDLDGEFGWVPASFLTPRDGEDADDHVLETFGDGEEEMCFAMGTYKPASDDEVGLEVGQILQVKQKNIDGWWLVSCDGTTGWAPCMFLRVLSTTRGYSHERETAMTNMKSIFAITDRRTTWNPVMPSIQKLSTVRKATLKKRRPHHDNIPEEPEEKPSYMNIEFNNKTNKKLDSDSSDEDCPSYVNFDFEKPDNKKAGKRRHDNNRHDNKDVQQGPSYMNMAFHNKNGEKARTRRRRDEDEDLVEIDFSKMKKGGDEETKKDPKIESKNDEKIDKKTASCESSTAQQDLKDEGPRVIFENDALSKPASADEECIGGDQSHMIGSELITQTTDSPEGDGDVFLSIGDYTKDADTEVNLQEGKSVQVLEQTDGGWWLVRTQSLSIGWAPSNFLEKITPEELQRRKELGLEPPELPPLLPPKSSRVHKKAVEICHERKFWSFVNKNGNNATCSIVDGDVNNNYFSNDDSEVQKPGEGDVIESKARWICDPETGMCKKEVDTKL